MNTFNLHKEITEDYKSYIKSFVNIKDERIKKVVDEGFGTDSIIPDPLIQFNPAYEKGCQLSQLINEQIIHADLDRIFKGFELYKHQEEAIRIGAQNKGFIVTSGTGSGKSLTFLATIFNQILLNKEQAAGIKAIIVYPMNALINSQEEEIHKYAIKYLSTFLNHNDSWNEKNTLKEQIAELERKTQKKFPIKYARYTGQEKHEDKERIRSGNYDILLTNYVMLELIMTRFDEYTMRRGMEKSMQFLVFDELHTYRGRRGADVSMLIRRIEAFCEKNLTIIGTSATMASGEMDVKKKIIADFAHTIFSKTYTEEQIIPETLVFSTNIEKVITTDGLKDAVGQKINPSLGENEFYNHPLAIWLEKEIALKKHEDGSIDRGKPLTMKDMINKLVQTTGASTESCFESIYSLLLWGEKLNIDAIARKERKAFLPFKIHQFISQTGTVYVTMEAPEIRLITLKEERYIKKGGDEDYLFPVLFSRYSGHDFICVELDHGNTQIKPRQTDDLIEKITQTDFKELKKAGIEPGIENLNKGYIIFERDGEGLWDDSMIENLPGSWYKVRANGDIVINEYHSLFIPRRIYIDNDGRFSDNKKSGFELEAWYLPSRILFDPTAGVIYDSRTAENTKLMRLGNDGRSTATTMTTISVLKALQRQGVERKNQKLLSFTDNRQDASLQAGHFNHFISVVRLRSALYYALKNAYGQRLSITDVAVRVKKELNLKEKEFARKPTPDESQPNPYNQQALEKYLFLMIMLDLKRGWRYILPNLELCGLLDFEFADLETLANNETVWTGDLLMGGLQPEQRNEILIQLLNYFRQGYAIDHKFYEKAEIEQNQKFMTDNLDEDLLWSLDKNERIDRPSTLFTEQIPDKLKRQVFYSSAGPQSNLGKYLKKQIQNSTGNTLKQDDIKVYLDGLMTVLSKNHFLVTTDYTIDDERHQGYQLNTQKLIWKLGDGAKIFRDEINYNYYKDINLKPNTFFQHFYQQNFSTYQANLVAREHTGQIDKDDRIEREESFKVGDIAALFCSPTMELGINISDLNLVHMRNVPPNPANYAQRSGRAGRSGQTALIINYCSLGSPHDRHYFNHSIEMVAGIVSAPKIDLANKELLNTHINAYLLMEMGLSQIQDSALDVLEVTNDLGDYPLKIEIAANIQNLINANKQRYVANIENFLKSNLAELEKQDWYSNTWVLHCVEQFLTNLDGAFDRWRMLFRNAVKQRIESQKVINDFTIKEGHETKKEAKRTYYNSQRQISLLTLQDDKSKANSEFYIFRYLASEGFLPGYNFVRLPIRTYLGRRSESGGTYVSRPRFVALREFGPQNIIYHNGNKYQVDRLMLPNTNFSENLRKIKVCVESSYAFMDDDGAAVNNDPITGRQLDTAQRVWVTSDLVEVAETIAEPQDRISSQEEERMRLGYQTDLYFNFPEGTEKAKKTTISNEKHELLKIWFYKSARLIEVNHKWRASRDDGFLVHKKYGTFEQLKNITDENREESQRVRLFTTDTSDMMLIQPISVLNLDEAGVVSLAYAMKRAIERLFQVEESEVGVHLLGKEDKNILIYEASEGSLGILSQIADDSQLLKKVFTEAYKVCHFDPDTRFDTKSDEIGKASYSDILSYYNQTHHDQLDRHSIKIALETLMDSIADNTRYFDTRQQNLDYLYDSYDRLSVMEKRFIDGLKKYDCKLPDKAQVNLSKIANTYASADFLYQDEKVLVFIDGNVHDRLEVANADSVKRRALFNAGYTVLVWKYTEPLEDFLKRNTHIFRCSSSGLKRYPSNEK